MALYHTHRPQTFSEITGQSHIVQTLMNQVSGNKVAHAYLFSGPRGVGKTTSARIIAKAINCLTRKPNEANPCNECDACRDINASRSIDIIEIDAASHTGVDNVRENIIENAQFKPSKLKFKVFIIDEVHMLSTSAFNALLKTLEEPPEHIIFILATTEKHKLPETIVSRCQRYDFKKISYDVMKKHLNEVADKEGVKIDKNVLDRIINKSDGCARDAISLLDQIMASGEKNLTEEIASVVLPTSNLDEVAAFVDSLVKKDSAACLKQIDRSAGDGVNLTQFAHDVIELLRVVMVSKANPGMPALIIDLNDKVKKALKAQESCITNSELVMLIDLMIRRRAEISNAPIPQLPLELAVIEWCGDTTTHQHENKKTQEEEKAEDKPSISPSPRGRAHEVARGGGQAEPKTIKEKVKEIVHSRKPNFTLDEVKPAWEEMIKKQEIDSPSLAFILKNAVLAKVDGNHVHIEVGYKFHKDKLIEKECSYKIEDGLEHALKHKVKIFVDVRESQADEPEQDTELTELTAAFGGEVVG